MNEYYQQALAAMAVEDVEFILSQLPPQVAATTGSVLNDVVEQRPKATDTADDSQDGNEDTRRWRHIEREWPEIGIELWTEYYGVRYTADVIPGQQTAEIGKTDPHHLRSGEGNRTLVTSLGRMRNLLIFQYIIKLFVAKLFQSSTKATRF